jgi:hypothetical protein
MDRQKKRPGRRKCAKGYRPDPFSSPVNSCVSPLAASVQKAETTGDTHPSPSVD